MNKSLKSCPVCDGPPEANFEKRSYIIATCRTCTHSYIAENPPPDHVESVFGDEYFTEGEDGYPDYHIGEDLLVKNGRRYARLLARYMSPGYALDVGAAAGYILKGLTEAGWQGDGIEPNATMAQFGREKFGLNVQVSTLEDADLNRRYDLVSMIQVVAHFYDVARAFEIAASVTKPGGWWLIETSDKESLPARVFGKNWHFISPPSVQNLFSRSTLTKLAARYYMAPVAWGRPRKWIKGAHAKSLLQHKLHGSISRVISPMLRLLPDGITVPYPSLDLFWILFRKQ